MHQLEPEIEACIDTCLDCYKTCLSEAMNHCLELGGAHTEKSHFTLMMACAELCRTAAHFMLIGSNQHHAICAECARICELCAADCERVGDMERCVDACRRCAESCHQMAA